MVKILTPRMGLTKESDDELIDPFAPNWPILDNIAGGISVAAGVTPPDNQLYDGALVVEQTTGKAWLARKDPITGAYAKSWLVYPWQCAAFNTKVTINTSGGTNSTATMNSFNAGQSINSTAADISTGKIQLPVGIPGIYSIQAYATFSPNSTGGLRSLFLSIDDNLDFTSSNMIEQGQISTYTTVLSTLIQNCNGNTVCAKVWQSSGGLLDVAVGIMATMITPM